MSPVRRTRLEFAWEPEGRQPSLGPAYRQRRVLGTPDKPKASIGLNALREG